MGWGETFWLDTPFLERLNLWFVAAWAALALHWLTRVGAAARRRQRLAHALWAIPGLLLLPLAPLLEVPALFGIGAAALLLSEWVPGAFRSGRRPRRRWGAALTLLGVGVVTLAPLSFLSLFGGTTLALWGAAFLVSAALWTPPARRVGWLPPSGLGKLDPASTFGTEVRWQPRQVPHPPELSVTLGQGFLLLHNETHRPLHLRGWSPAHGNAFLALDRTLAPAADHRLRRDPAQRGGRVWYAAPGSSEMRVLRADWQEPAPERTLN